VKWGVDFYSTFQAEFSTGIVETGANIVTLGGYGGIKSAYQEGRITATDATSAGRAYAEGVFNTFTLGAGERAIGAYAEGKGAGGIGLEAVKGGGETILPINEAKTLADSEKNAWEKAEAVATGTAKVAGLLAGGLAAKRALAPRATVATESAAGAEATMAPAEGVARPATPVVRRSYAVGDRLPDGRIAGEGPGAARRGGSEFSSGGTKPKGLRRSYIRKPVDAQIEANAPRTAEGQAIDPNLRTPIEGKPHRGHKYGREFRREKAKAEAEGLTQKEFNDRMNDPDLYQLEDPRSNMSHKFEKPGND
jgi:hypothetical protein